MFSSKFGIRLWKWIRSPKKYKLIFLISAKVDRFQVEYIRVEKEVIAHNRRQAIEIGREEINADLNISLVDSYSLGKVTSLEKTTL